jgi:hypothetical protein
MMIFSGGVKAIREGWRLVEIFQDADFYWLSVSAIGSIN